MWFIKGVPEIVQGACWALWIGTAKGFPGVLRSPVTEPILGRELVESWPTVLT